jgi:hypothetical protein
MITLDEAKLAWRWVSKDVQVPLWLYAALLVQAFLNATAFVIEVLS